MHVVRKSGQQLVILDSSIWISLFLSCVTLLLLYRAAVVHPKPVNYLPAAFFLLFVLLLWRREVVVFDASRQQAEWTRRRLFKVQTGTVPFSDIEGIGMESTSGDRTPTYRLTILTAGSSIPMSDNYSGNRENYEKLKQEILDFLNLDPEKTKSAPGTVLVNGVDDQASIRSLLRQGRKIDAIELIRSTQKISLVEAKDRVDTIDDAMKAGH